MFCVHITTTNQTEKIIFYNRLNSGNNIWKKHQAYLFSLCMYSCTGLNK